MITTFNRPRHATGAPHWLRTTTARARVCVFAVAALLTIPVPGLAQPTVPPEHLCGDAAPAAICAGDDWSSYDRAEVRARSGDFDGSYTLRLPRGGEIYAKVNEKFGPNKRNSEIILFSDQNIAFRSSEALEPGPGVDDILLNAPVQMLQLTSALLGTALPKGPVGVTGTQAVNVSESKRFIRSGTPSAAALYGPPWRVKGTVRRVSSTKIGFNLEFTFRPVNIDGALEKGASVPLTINGTMDFPEQPEPLPDSFSLVGWTLIGNAGPLPKARTLGEARKLAAKP